MNPEILEFIFALLAGSAVAGYVAGLFGIGGGSIMVTVLYFVFSSLGYPTDHLMHCAVATSSAVIIISSIKSVQVHHSKRAVDWQILWPPNKMTSWGVWFGVGAFVGSAILARYISGQQLKLLFGVVMGLVSLQLIFGRPNWTLRNEMPKGLAIPGFGGTLGALCAMVGIGGGAINVSLMVMCGKSIHRAIGTAAGIGLFVSVPATLGFLISGQGIVDRPPISLGFVNIPGFALMAITAVLFVPLGARTAHSLSQRPLKRGFGLFLLIISIKMISDGLS